MSTAPIHAAPDPNRMRMAQHYLEPATAWRTGTCPADVTIDLFWAAKASLLELTGVKGARRPFLELYRDLLEPGVSDLKWRDGGLGRGRELRNAMSALFGRFFARTYLEMHHDITWFASIDGDTDFKNFKIVRRKPNHPGEKVYLPDWVCSRTNEVLLAESKGSMDPALVRGVEPDKIRKASDQLKNAEVIWKTGPTAGKRQTKGWAVLNRWGQGSAPPLIHAKDPWTEGDSWQSPEIEAAVQQIATRHLQANLAAIGDVRFADCLTEGQANQALRRRTYQVRHPLAQGSNFIGRFLVDSTSELGIDEYRQSRAVAAQTGLLGFARICHPTERIYFLGQATDQLLAGLQGAPIPLHRNPDVSRRSQEAPDEEIILGADGSILCHADYVTESREMEFLTGERR